jgi:Flp pilus assembly protein TadB
MRKATMEDPRTIYAQLLKERHAEITAREKGHQQLGYFRLLTAVAAAVVLWLAIQHTLTVLWVLVPVAAFIFLIVLHERLLKRLDRRKRAAAFFEKGLARLDGKWAGTGETGERYADPEHPYAADLDLFGKGSLFELLCTARTHIGEDTLARWLTSPAEPPVIRERQEAVAELRPRVALREDLAVVAEEARSGVDPVSLAAWGESAGPGGVALDTRANRILVPVLAIFGVAGGVALFCYMLAGAGLLPITPQAIALLRDFLLVVLAVNGTFLYRQRHEFSAVVGSVEAAADQLGLLTEVLVRLEQESFQTPLLARLRASLDADGEPPSQRLARLKRIVEYIDSRDNVAVKLAEIFILWTPQWALKVEEWRRHSGPAVRRWLTATGEIEALCALASHAFEHPADPFPELTDATAAGPLLEAEGAAHPLIPEGEAIRNDIRIGDGLQLLVVSGSNMSGKSTFLRTLGTNVALAQAGAPVRARRMLLSPLVVGASIRIVDSLQGGISRFYAEILRLRQILDLTSKGRPVLFLIDEVLSGTNSHDRRIGAEAIVRGLVDRGAIGLITTHDLALADIAEGLGSRAANVHFEDRIENGQIIFDYIMRPGVVRKSNAIELMRSVGLEI